MNVGVFVLVEVADAIDHRLRLLRGGAVVEPDRAVAIHNLAQDGKIAANRFHVEGVGREAEIARSAASGPSPGATTGDAARRSRAAGVGSGKCEAGARNICARRVCRGHRRVEARVRSSGRREWIGGCLQLFSTVCSDLSFGPDCGRHWTWNRGRS